MYFLLVIIIIIIIIVYYINISEQFITSDAQNILSIEQQYTDVSRPVSIKSQIPVPQNHLSDKQLLNIDSSILRNIRAYKRFSNTDELDFYQMYNLLKQIKTKKIDFIYKSLQHTSSNNLFLRIKLELISLLNSLVISNGYYNPYHQYQFLKIINSNLIKMPETVNTLDMYIDNYIFTLTIGRDYKYQHFTIYYDIDVNKNNIYYTIKINKNELIGLPIPQSEKINNNIPNVLPNKDGKLFESQYTKYIDDIDMFVINKNTEQAYLEQHKLNIAKDKHINKHKCFGLVNGISKELVAYNNNAIFCGSYHPEIGQVGIFDAPCQLNSDCPFYKKNINYPNSFGKCDTITGKCEMPQGIIPIGFTKYGKIEPDCYNCDMGHVDNKCCNNQFDNIKNGKVSYKSPDYIFKNDNHNRKQYAEILENNGLMINPSI